MERFCPVDKCSGCGACANACPRNAISMQKCADGFLRPTFDAGKCVECGLCEKSCPIVKDDISGNVPQEVALAWCKNEGQRTLSSSGGIFAQLATLTIAKGGVVCGAAFDENMQVVHQFVDNLDELHILQSSKYVQSKIGDSFKKVKDYLNDGRHVYFVGTPCQVAGLKSFLKKEYATLLTSDLICHGAPSNALFKKQVESFERKYGSKIVDWNFRSKKRFGQGYDIEVSFENGTRRFFNAELVPYFYGFWRNISLRESCYQCKFSSEKRVSDITLGDYWLAKKIHHVKTSKGTSLILVNTAKGADALSQCSPSIEKIPDNLERVKKIQAHLSRPVKKPKSHESFVDDFQNDVNWDVLSHRYFHPPFKYRLKMRVRNFIKTVTFYKFWK